MVPAAASAGSVAPMVSRHFCTAFSASSASTTLGPAPDMNSVSSP
jgi:hypothetical protein